jgi:hypothetical protein
MKARLPYVNLCAPSIAVRFAILRVYIQVPVRPYTTIQKEEDTNVFGMPFRTDNNDYARGVTHLIIT